MIRRMRVFFRGETFRYLVFGVLTVVVNIVSYRVLASVCGSIVSNTAAFFIAVLFAYWTNSTFVFRVGHTWKNFVQFMGMRVGTLAVDDGGMWLLLKWGCNDIASKCVVNVAIIIINYIASKTVIFRKQGKAVQGE